MRSRRLGYGWARAILLFIMVLCVAVVSDAQKKSSGKKYATKSKKAIAQYEQGMEDYGFDRWQKALLEFETAKKIDPKFTEAYFACSEVYKDLGNYEGQFENIAKAVALDSTMYVTAYMNAGIALCNLGRFAEANVWFDKYMSKVKKKPNPKAKFWMERALAAKELMEHPVPYNPHYVAPLLVSEYDQYWPSITLDEEELVYTVLVPRDSAMFAMNPYLPKNPQNFHEDFYFSKKKGGEWTEPVPMYNINTKSNEGAQALSADGQWMFFTACGRNDSKGSCDIYFSRRTKKGWSTPINIGAPVNTPYWESQPCFSADGQTLYFVSNRPGGKGAQDIWSATITGYLDNGVPTFSAPVNLGDSINTKGEETSPFLHPDNKTLYFSSDGWPGVGQLDIFMSRRNEKGEWSTPKNIGYPINTPMDDNGLVISASGKTAYLASARQLENGTKKKELLCFELPEEVRPEPVSYIKGHVYDNRTMEPLEAEMELIRLEDGGHQVNAKSDAQNGNFVVNLPSGKDYALIISKPGYLFHSQNFALVEIEASSNKVVLDVPLSPIIKDEKMTLKNVFFDSNSAELKPESYIELDKMVELMKRNPTLKIEIGGHTDNVGQTDYNMKLSEGRARVTMEYIVSKGIEQERIRHKGYGMTQPIETNDTEEGRAQNRRIEAKIVEK